MQQDDVRLHPCSEDVFVFYAVFFDSWNESVKTNCGVDLELEEDDFTARLGTQTQ